MNSNVKKDVIITDEIVGNYINFGEKVVGFGLGGSESLTIFLNKPGEEQTTVRKILSERLITAHWECGGKDVMLAPHKKAKQQAYFLKNLPDHVRPFFPFVGEIVERSIAIDLNKEATNKFGDVYNELIYDMSFIEGDEVSEFVRKYQPSPAVVARLYVIIYQLLNKLIHNCRVRVPIGPTLESSYFAKIENRLELSRKTSPNVFSSALLDSDHIYIDGIKYLNVRPLLNRFRLSPKYLKILEPTRHTLVVGDTNTENVKITKPVL